MSGLLRRLARQAIRSGEPRIHSVANLPFVSASAIESQVSEVARPRSASEPAKTATLRERTEALTEATDDSDDSPPVRPDVRRALLPEVIENIAPVAEAADEPPVRSASLEPAAPTMAINDAPSGHFEHDPTRVERPAPLSVRPLSARPSLTARRRGAEPDMASEGRGASNASPGSARQEVAEQIESAPLSEPPAMLLPPVVPPSNRRAPHALQQAPTRKHRELLVADEPNEVHVHIGRVEVTAVHEPAPAKRKERPRKQPLSLDDYLAKRRRSRE